MRWPFNGNQPSVTLGQCVCMRMCTASVLGDLILIPSLSFSSTHIHIHDIFISTQSIDMGAIWWERLTVICLKCAARLNKHCTTRFAQNHCQQGKHNHPAWKSCLQSILRQFEKKLFSKLMFVTSRKENFLGKKRWKW